MTSPSTAVPEDDIHAYVDGALDPQRQAEVASAVANDPRKAELVEVYRNQISGLHQLYDYHLDESVPARFLAAVQSSKPSAGSSRWVANLQRVAAALAIFALGGVAGIGGHQWVFKKRDLLQPFVHQAVLSHQILESENPKAENLVSESGDVIDVAGVSSAFDVPLRVPSLRGVDSFVPVALREMEGGGAPVAQLLYKDSEGNNVTLYIRPHSDRRTVPFETTTDDGFEAVYWIDGPLIYVLVGSTVSKDALAKIARAVYSSHGLLDQAKPALEIKSEDPAAKLPLLEKLPRD